MKLSAIAFRFGPPLRGLVATLMVAAQVMPSTARADATAQVLPFTQNWSTTGAALSTTDDWSGVSGIIGYRGDLLAGTTGTDPRTITAADDPGVVDVNVNQLTTATVGGVAEFEGLVDPVVGLQGSGTAQAPYLKLHLSTSGRYGIRLAYNVRDVDGTTDNAIQQVNAQYRIGGAGTWTNIAGTYIADATTGPSLATLVTPISVQLPAACENQALVQVRIMTTNAVGNDEWASIDDISVTYGAAITIADAPSTAEGALHTFDVTLDAPQASNVTVDFQTADNTATVANNDFSPTSGTLTWLPGETLKQINVTCFGDATLESDETFFVNLTNGINGGMVDAQGVGTLLNDDTAPQIDIELVALSLESVTPANLKVTLSNMSDTPVSVDYQSFDGSATLDNNDYVAATGTATFPAKTTEILIPVTINNDTKFEGDENLTVVISNPVGGTIGNNTGTITIQNDDTQPTIDIEPVALSPEGSGFALLYVSLSNASDQAVSVDYQSFDGSATLDNNDYQATTGTVTFPPKTTNPQPITVLLNNDTKFEGDETLTVVLSNPVGGSIGNNTGTITIQNDDTQPVIDIELVQLVLESVGTAQLAVTLSNTSDQPVSVDYQSFDGSATEANGDYTGAGGTLTWPAKDASTQYVVIPILDDGKDEPDQDLTVGIFNPVNASIGNNTGTITIQDNDGTPSVSIDDVTLAEGDFGVTSFTFNVSLSHTSDDQIEVFYQTVAVSPNVGDYFGQASSVVFAPKDAGPIPITIQVFGDTDIESDETFNVELTGATGATISDNIGVGTIVNDDLDTTDPSVTVLSPNGGETLIVGTMAKLSWNAIDNVGVTSVDLHVSRDNGTTYVPIAIGEANDGTYDWLVSSPGTNPGPTQVFSALLKVVAYDAALNDGEDVSDAPFSIYDLATPTLLLLFDADAAENGIEVRWQLSGADEYTRQELERAEAAQGPWSALSLDRVDDGGVSVVLDNTARPSREYFYRVVATDRNGQTVVFGPASGSWAERITASKLGSITPNPMMATTRVEFELAQATRARLSVHDLQGREIAVLAEGRLPSGRHLAIWDGRTERGAVPAGVYFVRFQTDQQSFVKRLVKAH